MRTEFLRDEVPWEAEADLLLSDLCSQVGYELYAMDTDLRAYLLEQMQQDGQIPPERMQQVAQLLMSYVQHLREIHPAQRQRELQAQRWAAMAYLGEERCQQMVEEIVTEFEMSGNEGNSNIVKAELARLARIAEELTVQLANYPELLRYTEKVNLAIRQPQTISSEELQQVHPVAGRGLRLPGSKNIPGFPPLEILSFTTAKCLESANSPESVSISSQPPQAEEPREAAVADEEIAQSEPLQRILIIGVNPKGTTLEQEAQELKELLRRSRNREPSKRGRFIDTMGQFLSRNQNQLVVEYATVTRARDVRRAILDYNPQVVHFCGHGEGEQGLVLEEETGAAKLVSTEALASLFKLFAKNVNCVLLNACYSVTQAEAIAQHIDTVIGMSQPIGDRAADDFALGFYDALGSGQSVDFAFRAGYVSMEIQGNAREHFPVMFKKSPHPAPKDGKRIFISYKRGAIPDEPVALALYAALKQQTHNVFIDQGMPIGTPWAEKIEAELQQADYFIPLLSRVSVQSEMLKGEIETAHQLSQSERGKPKILPIRVDYREAFTYPLSACLNHINWAFWDSDADTANLIEELNRAIAGQELPIDPDSFSVSSRSTPISRPLSVVQLESPGGTMDVESRFYVQREGVDDIALAAIQQQGVTITIKGSRQMGKSSLLTRIMAAASQTGKRVAYLDLVFFGREVFVNADSFFQQFCTWLSDALGLENKVAEFWDLRLGSGQCCSRYIERYILKELGQPLVIAIDEVDYIFQTDVRSDFFAMLRNWHNNRAIKHIWEQLDIVLVIFTEPYQWDGYFGEPFNCGQAIEPYDFNPEQVADLIQRHGLSLNPLEIKQFHELLSGHPYLVQQALYLLACGKRTFAELLATATDNSGPFSDHLRTHLFRLSNQPELRAGMLQVIHQQTCDDEQIFFQLQSAGLVKREGRKVLPRNQLYARYFQEHLNG